MHPTYYKEHLLCTLMLLSKIFNFPVIYIDSLLHYTVKPFDISTFCVILHECNMLKKYHSSIKEHLYIRSYLARQTKNVHMAGGTATADTAMAVPPFRVIFFVLFCVCMYGI